MWVWFEYDLEREREGGEGGCVGGGGAGEALVDVGSSDDNTIRAEEVVLVLVLVSGRLPLQPQRQPSGFFPSSSSCW